MINPSKNFIFFIWIFVILGALNTCFCDTKIWFDSCDFDFLLQKIFFFFFGVKNISKRKSYNHCYINFSLFSFFLFNKPKSQTKAFTFNKLNLDQTELILKRLHIQAFSPREGIHFFQFLLLHLPFFFHSKQKRSNSIYFWTFNFTTFTFPDTLQKLIAFHLWSLQNIANLVISCVKRDDCWIRYFTLLN